jgi:hypothetical protein
VAISDTIATRSALRDALQRDLLETLNRQFRPLLELVTDGENGNGHAPPMSEAEVDERILAGARAIAEVKVLTRKDILDAVHVVFEQPIPAPPNDTAEVSTIKGKATVVVATECPECHIAHPIILTVTPELLVDSDGKELRIKSKAKGRTHVCGQLPLPEADDEQATLDEALAGEADDLADDLADELRIRILGAVSVAEDDEPPIPTVDRVAQLMDPPLESESDRGDLAETLDRYAAEDEPALEARQDKDGPRTYWLTPAGDELLERAEEAMARQADVDDADESEAESAS